MSFSQFFAYFKQILITNGAAHFRPIPGTGKSLKGRYIPAAICAHPGDDTNNSMTFSETDNVTELTISWGKLTAEDTDAVLLVTFDQVNGSTAGTALDAPSFDQDGATEVYAIPYGKSRTFYASAGYFSRADFEIIGTTTPASDTAVIIGEGQ